MNITVVKERVVVLSLHRDSSEVDNSFVHNLHKY